MCVLYFVFRPSTIIFNLYSEYKSSLIGIFDIVYDLVSNQVHLFSFKISISFHLSFTNVPYQWQCKDRLTMLNLADVMVLHVIIVCNIELDLEAIEEIMQINHDHVQ